MLMKARYRLICRTLRGNKYYCVDVTGKRTSLGTANEDDAQQIVLAKNQALRQPVLNLQIARAYLTGTDSAASTRTWQHALDALIETKRGANQDRWRSMAAERPERSAISVSDNRSNLCSKPCRPSVRCSLVSHNCTNGTARNNFGAVIFNWVLKASVCTAIVTLGRNGPR